MSKPATWTKEAIDSRARWERVEDAVYEIYVRWMWTLTAIKLDAQALAATVEHTRLERGGLELLVEGMPRNFTWSWA